MEAQCDVSVEAQAEVVVEDVNRKLRNSRNHQTTETEVFKMTTFADFNALFCVRDN